ncbi:hypothetical protein NI456_09730 [Brevundimonas diminuta]|uniref:hypothetical protein n=1 Tax=Brevundimonas diminuta TaxID=293 RepID=UPI0020975F05|nr:hypothetical protein [Brevundimonas diminuta]MCO8019137.1 hypothetical protein [Brevundimonas diminuta]MCO8021814.1 hypothetical protein [Brevundimonas diminuta]
MFRQKATKYEAAHSVSFRAFGLSIDGKGLGGVIVVPVILLIIVLAGTSIAGGAAWLARLFPNSAPISEVRPEGSGPKDISS